MKIKRRCRNCGGKGRIELVGDNIRATGDCYWCQGVGRVMVSLEEATDTELDEAYEEHYSACGLIAEEQGKRGKD